MTPRIGQLVDYRLSDQDIGYIHAEGLHSGGQAEANPGQIVPAIVTALPQLPVMGPVLDDQGQPTGRTQPTGEMRTGINLKVLIDGTDNIWCRDAANGTEHGQWTEADQAVDLGGFYSRQIQPVINSLQAQIQTLSSRLDALEKAETSEQVQPDTPTPVTPPAPSTPVA